MGKKYSIPSKQYVDDRFDALHKGPNGIYETLGDLVTADPEKGYIYLILSDGYWYYWDHETSLWTKGTQYGDTPELVELKDEAKMWAETITEDPNVIAVGEDLRGPNNIGVVAPKIADVTKVANIEADVTKVANIDGEVVALADRKAKIDALFNDLPTIAQKANKDYVDGQLESTQGVGWDGTSIVDILGQYAVANGLATLDGDGKIYLTQIPSLPMMDVHVVASKNDMLSLAAIKGDIAIRTDLPSVFILSAEDPTEEDDWIELSDIQNAVDTALGAVKGTGWNGETIKEVSDGLQGHMAASMPHKFRNHKEGKNYLFGFRVSDEGYPQIIFEEEN